MKQDRFLLGILIGIGLLVVISVVVFFARQGQVAYQPEDDPAGVVYNYVLALQKGDFQRAYSYLADGANKPDAARFQQDFASGKLDLSTVGVEVGAASVSGEVASVAVTLVHTNRGPFEGGSWREYQTVSMQRRNGAWKIINFPYPYWGWDWYQTPAPVKP